MNSKAVSRVMLFDIGHNGLMDESKDKEVQRQHHDENPFSLAFTGGKRSINISGLKRKNPTHIPVQSLIPPPPVAVPTQKKKCKMHLAHPDLCCHYHSINQCTPHSFPCAMAG